MVERIEGAYYVRNARGRELGRFADLDSARQTIGSDPEPPVAPRRPLTVNTDRLSTLLWTVNFAGAVVAAALAFALLR
jgi:hypothetical protein